MKLYIIYFKEVDYEEDNAVLVSAENETQAKVIAGIEKPKPNWGNRYEDNVEEIKEIGTYNFDAAEEILKDNRGA